MNDSVSETGGVPPKSADELEFERIMEEARNEPIVGSPQDPRFFGVKAPDMNSLIPKVSQNVAAEYEEMRRLNAIERSRKYELMTNCESVTDLIGLREVMSRYVLGMFESEARGVRLFELNRRFGMRCKRLGSTTRAQMNLVCEEGRISGRAYRGFYVYIDDKKFYEGIQKILSQAEKDKYTAGILNRSYECLIS